MHTKIFKFYTKSVNFTQNSDYFTKILVDLYEH